MPLNPFFQIIIATSAGYFLGSLNGAQLIHHILRSYFPKHITRIGTKIAGTQNVWMQIGKLPALFVLCIDILKGYLAIVIANLIGLESPLNLIGGIAATAGHNWPIFFHLRGGRGVATLAGALIALDFNAMILAGTLSQIFTLIRWSGIMPFSLLLGIGVMRYSLWGNLFIILLSLGAIIILASRLHAYWPYFIKTDRKLWVLKNIIFYDRPGANPPPLRELFNFAKLKELIKD